MSELVDWAYRTLELLALSLFPYWAALDVAPATTRLTTLTRLAWLALWIAFGAACVRYGWRAHRALVLAGSGVLALAAWRAYAAHGLERELPFVAPPFWLTILGAQLRFGSSRQGFVEPRRRSRFVGVAWRQGGPWLLASLAAVLLSFGVAWPRVGSELGARRATLQRDPGNEPAALRLAQLLEATEGPRSASAVLRACARINPLACGCLTSALERDVGREAYAAAVELLHGAAPACAHQPEVLAMSAEIAAATAVGESFAAKVALATERAPTLAHTLYAQALVNLRREDLAAARELCERAIAAGRGVAAHATLGAILYRLGELEGAEASLATALQGDPENLAALYNLALLDQVRQRAAAARSGYARVLELSPRHWDARYNLALVALSTGNRAEAERQLAALEGGAGLDDARARALRNALGTH